MRQGLTLRVVPNKKEEVLGLLLVVEKTVMLIVKEGFWGNFSCQILMGKLTPPTLSFIFIFFITYFFLPPRSHKIHFNQLKVFFVIFSLLRFLSLSLGFFHLCFLFSLLSLLIYHLPAQTNLNTLSFSFFLFLGFSL